MKTTRIEPEVLEATAKRAAARQQQAREDLSGFGDRILALLADRGWSRNDLAREAGVDSASLHRYVKQGCAPITRHLLAIADALGTSTDSLLRRAP